jgi:YbbR domain-containing protein
MAMARWLWDNLSTLALAFILSLAVWIAAVNTDDPLSERSLPGGVPLEIVNLPEGLQLVGFTTPYIQVNIKAPESTWNQLTTEDVHATLDLQGLQTGEHTLPVSVTLEARPAIVSEIDPASVTLSLDVSTSKSMAVDAELIGEIALGYQANKPTIAPDHVLVSGPAKAVERVERVRASVRMTGRREDFDQEVRLEPLDALGERVPDVELDPAFARLTIVVEQLGGYRLVAILPIVEGQVASGYQVTGLSVSPTLVTVYSSDPSAVDALPGYIETLPVEIAGAEESVTKRVTLRLPNGVSQVDAQPVEVRVDVAAIEITTTLTTTLETQGLRPGLFAQVSPESVSVILKGPLPVLDKLRAGDLQVALDLQGLGAGTHQVTPHVVNLPANVAAQTIVPDTVQVVITIGPPATVTPSP